MTHLIPLIVAFPLLSGLLLIASGKIFQEPLAGWIATAAVGCSFVVTLVVFLHGFSDTGLGTTSHVFPWINVGNFHANVDFTVDQLSITMCLFVTGISTLIHLYSIGYMHGETYFRKFFIYLNLFVA